MAITATWSDTYCGWELTSGLSLPDPALLDSAAWWVNASDVAADGLSLKDLSGNNRPAVLGTAAAKPTVLPYAGRAYLYEAPQTIVAGNGLSAGPNGFVAPVPAATVQFVVEGTMAHRTDVSSQVTQYGNTTDGWIILASNTGVLYSRLYQNSVLANVTLKASGGYSTKGWHRFTLALATGAVLYEDSDDGIAWAAHASGTHVPPTRPLDPHVRFLSASAAVSVPGTYYSASVTVDGVKVGAVDPANAQANHTQIRNTGTLGGYWIVTRAATGYKLAVVDRPLVLFGGAQWADSTALPVSPERTILAAFRVFGTNASLSWMLIDTRTSATDTDGTDVYRMGGTSNAAAGWNDGTTTRTSTIADSSLDGQSVYGARITAGGILQAYSDAGGWGTAYTAAAMKGGGAKLRVGSAYSGSGMEGEFIAAAVWDRALTDAEVARAAGELTVGTAPDQVNWWRTTHWSDGRVLSESAGTGNPLVDTMVPVSPGATTTYYAQSSTGQEQIALTAPVFAAPVLSIPSDPSVPAVQVTVQTQREWIVTGRTVVYTVLGRNTPWVEPIPPIERRGQLVLRLEHPGGGFPGHVLDGVRDMLRTGKPMLLRTVCPERVETLSFIATEVTETHIGDPNRHGPDRLIDIAWQAVEPLWGDDVEVAARLWFQVPLQFGTWNDVKASGLTWDELAWGST